MRVRCRTNLLLLAVVLIPVALTAQESEPPLPISAVSFLDIPPGPVSLALPQSGGEKSAALAALLNAFVFPGVGNFYAGNSGHGIRHVALAFGGSAVLLVGLGKTFDEDTNDNAGVWLVAGALVAGGNLIWSIFSGIEDARAAGRPDGPSGGMASMLQPRLVPLGLPSATSDPLTKHRLGLQLVRITF